MIKSPKNLKKGEQLKIAIQGTNFAIYEANRDKERYNEYKENKTEKFDKDTLREMKILDILQKLGYPMEELGTYLYKDLIAEISNELKYVQNNESKIEKYNEILSELTNVYSNLYHSIANEWKELGTKNFHLCIQKAVEQINYKDSDKELSRKIYGNSNQKLNYGVNAFQIARYISKKNTHKLFKPKTKKLSNISNDIK